MAISSIQDVKTRGFWVAALSELLGTLFLVLVACGACANFKQDRDPIVQIALAFGLSVATIVWVIARVSGGHINPAVTFGFLVTRKITVLRASAYILSQCVGAILGAAILKAVSPDGVNNNLGHCAPGGKDDAQVSITQAFFVELLITFILVWTVFGTCDPQRKDLAGSGPLAIGLSIAMCHLWAIPYTGSGMNPARVLGPAIVSKNIGAEHWAYWVGPLAGAALAALLYDFVMAVNATGAKLKGFVARNYDDAQYDKQGKRPGHSDENLQMKNAA